MVIGVSAGVGKSTFANQLGENLHIKVHHLDKLFWKPNWVEASREEFISVQEEIVKDEEWIIEGNYSNTFESRLRKADTIIYLELPLYVCLYRVLKRRIQHHGKVRPDMTMGCEEKLDWEFLKYILKTYSPRKRKMREYFQSLQDSKEVIILNKKRDMKMFLEQLKVS